MVHLNNKEASAMNHRHTSKSSTLKPSKGANKVQKLYMSPGSLSRGLNMGLRPQKQLNPNFMLRNSNLRHRALYAPPPGSMICNFSDAPSKDMESQLRDYIDNGDKVIDIFENENDSINMEVEDENLETRSGDNARDNNIDSIIDNTGSSANNDDVADKNDANNDNNEGANKKRRGRNKNEMIARLAPGEKLEVIFFRKRVVGKYQKLFSRHLGKIVRDGNICPIKVQDWSEIGDDRKNHMWAAVLDKFTCAEGMESHREDMIEHMRDLWRNWRGEMSNKHIKDKTLQEALKEKVQDMDKEDWEWLVKEHYFSEKFQETSARNSSNRSGLKKQMLHRTGSRPFCDVAWELGGKEGKEVGIETMWQVTRSKGNKWATEEAAQKHDVIVKAMNENPQMSYIELVDKCFKPQHRDHIVCYRGGIRPKDLRGPCPSRAQLEEELRKKNQELSSVRDELKAHREETKADKRKMQGELDMLKDVVLRLARQNNDAPLNLESHGDDDNSDSQETPNPSTTRLLTHLCLSNSNTKTTEKTRVTTVHVNQLFALLEAPNTTPPLPK